MVPLTKVGSRRARFSLALIFGMAAGGCASAPTTGNSRSAAPMSPPAVTLPGYARQALYQQIHGACRVSMRPNRAVIVGGMSAAGIKPTDTAARLDQQLDTIRRLADEENATLRLRERVRAARASEPRGGREEPYVVVQRFEIETDPASDVDRLLERTLQAGLDRYGTQAGVDHGSGWRPLVVYRFSDLEQRLQSAHDQCREDAVRAWCEQSGDDPRACVEELNGADLQLLTDQFTLASQPVTQANGVVDSIQLIWPFMATAPIELGGDAELQFSGTITLRGIEKLR